MGDYDDSQNNGQSHGDEELRRWLENFIIKHPHLTERIRERSSADDVPMLITALQHAYKVLDAQGNVVQAYEEHRNGCHEFYRTRASLTEAIANRDNAMREALEFEKQFREQEQQVQRVGQ